ncbi:UNVERIFIED_CONTAM: hypothetical protein Slati_1725300 [Sesamum latifolium]|uniref:RNase H type-1 domain-containing protein n=1 Tax=Sesamum latifolium TaxID=2727402 RepID=A0AAW2WWF9_9LAMI
MALALVITARKLRPYFLSYPVGVRTNTPLKEVLGKPETSGRLIKWTIELTEYDISYLPRTTIKAQALADFVSEMTGTTQEEVHEMRPCLLHVDGSSTAQWSGAGIVLTTPQGDDMEFAVKFEFKAPNNETEYEALVLGMGMAQDAGASHLLAYSDSQLIVKQVNREYETKEESMAQYLQQIEELKTKFKSFQLHQIPREKNIKADSLSKIASALEDCKTRRITVQHLPQSRIPLDIQPISSNNNDWRTPIICWIDEGHLLGDRWEATKIKKQSHPFPNARRDVIQEVFYTSSTQVPISRRRLTRTQRNTRGMLRIPHRDLRTSQQSTKSWLLLAHYEARRTLLGEQVRGMPKTRHPHTPTC